MTKVMHSQALTCLFPFTAEIRLSLHNRQIFGQLLKGQFTVRFLPASHHPAVLCPEDLNSLRISRIQLLFLFIAFIANLFSFVNLNISFSSKQGMILSSLLIYFNIL